MPKNLGTKIEKIEAKELAKFVDENTPERDFKTMKDIVGNMVCGKIIKVERVMSDYKGKPIENRHLTLEDDVPVVISVSGVAVIRQVDDFFLKNPCPVGVKFTIAETTGKDGQLYRQFVATKA